MHACIFLSVHFLNHFKFPTTTQKSLTSHTTFYFHFSGFQPLPEPSTGDDDDAATPSSVHGVQPPLSPPAPSPVVADSGGGESAPPSPAVMGEWHEWSPGAPAPVSGDAVDGDGGENTGEIPSAVHDGGVRWCAVRDEVEDCQFLVSVISQLTGDTWKW